jgi:hypothetical protein
MNAQSSVCGPTGLAIPARLATRLPAGLHIGLRAAFSAEANGVPDLLAVEPGTPACPAVE